MLTLPDITSGHSLCEGEEEGERGEEKWRQRRRRRKRDLLILLMLLLFTALLSAGYLLKQVSPGSSLTN